jgi:hypothetical protein
VVANEDIISRDVTGGCVDPARWPAQSFLYHATAFKGLVVANVDIIGRDVLGGC